MRLPEDRTSRAVIRDQALRLFAERGADAVSLREIASAAGVSAALIIRHFGSKDGLREEVDRFVERVFGAMMGELTAPGALPFEASQARSLVDAIVAHLPGDSPIPRYLGRLLLEGGDAGRRLFQRIFEIGARTLDAMAAAGLCSAGSDPAVRAAFLTCNDLAALLLREHVKDALGIDPLGADGMVRWSAEVLDVYARGLGVPPNSTASPSTKDRQ